MAHYFQHRQRDREPRKCGAGAISAAGRHISVLQKEVLEFLDPKPDQNFIDCTAGAGGHSLEILKKTAPGGRLLCLDLDAQALAGVKLRAREELSGENKEPRMTLVNANFADLKKIAEEYNFLKVNGILADLGFSSDQIERSGRGFSFQKNEPLDMRYSAAQKLTAREAVNKWPQDEIEKILKEYGEERFWRRIAEEIIMARREKLIETTEDLVGVISRSIPKKFQYGRIHFATRSFQALRVAVNDELGNLAAFLPQALEILAPAGRLAVISFHSLEDRIVKNFFRDNAKSRRIKILTKKPIVPLTLELSDNPRSRSAKLRVCEKL